MNPFKKIFYSLRLREAVRMAENAWRETNSRHYVMPLCGSRGKLIIVDRRNFRILKRKHYLSPNATTADLARECFYCTPFANGEGRLLDKEAASKRLQYFRWLDAEHNLRKRKKAKR